MTFPRFCGHPRSAECARTTKPGNGQPFGTGLAGTGGFAPNLHAAGCPRIGSVLGLQLWNLLGQSVGTVAISTASAAFPIFGGTGYLLPPFVLQLPYAADGSAGAGGAGSASVFQFVSANPALIGLPLYAQAGGFDPGAPQSVALSNGLELTLGS
jgi:hypothetical protein